MSDFDGEGVSLTEVKFRKSVSNQVEPDQFLTNEVSSLNGSFKRSLSQSNKPIF